MTDRGLRGDRPASGRGVQARAAVASPVAVPGRLAGFPPVWRADARLLVLGSFPSVASLGAAQYYAHPRNQFWPILGRLIGVDLPSMAYPERLEAVKAARVAIWDVLGSCEREGSLDTAIRDAHANQFDPLLAGLPALRAVAFNGGTAGRAAPWFGERGLATLRLPSTSPAHAALDLEAKFARWRVLVDEGWIAR